MRRTRGREGRGVVGSGPPARVPGRHPQHRRCGRAIPHHRCLNKKANRTQRTRRATGAEFGKLRWRWRRVEA